MKIRITAFGYIAEIVKRSTFELESATDLNTLRKKLEEKFPEIKKHPYKIALNRELVNDNRIIEEDSEIALLPPFAGG